MSSGNYRDNSVAIAGGVLGDEGKGRVTEEITSRFLENHDQVIHYRDNGGANAGHTVIANGEEVKLHQIGSGIFHKNCTVILGKDMVLHPTELLIELDRVKEVMNGKVPADVKIDKVAALSLDTHRAFETVLKKRKYGNEGSTGRGISPAYADIVYRHPLRIRDLYDSDWRQKLKDHFDLYQKLISGLGEDIFDVPVKRLDSETTIDSFNDFANQVEEAKEKIEPFVENVRPILEKKWNQKGAPFVFEKAQGVGLDKRWGVYPDVTASDCSFSGITSSTEGVIVESEIEKKALVVKATYSSSVGSREMPTEMSEDLAHKIREDAGEYGATTGRPRGILHIDIPMMSYLAKVSNATHLVMTHLDISYPDVPVKVCVGYEKNGEEVGYKPDQKYLRGIKPQYKEFESWDREDVGNVDNFEQLPNPAQKYVEFLSDQLNLETMMITYGPESGDTVML